MSLVGQGLSMLVMAAAFGLPALSGVVGPVALIFTLLYVFAFALGTGPVPGLLSAELLPVSIRGALTVSHAGVVPTRSLAGSLCFLGAGQSIC